VSFKKGDKKVIKAWVMYDWANSVYPLVITTAIFPLFYDNWVNKEAEINNLDDGTAEVFGMYFNGVEIYSYAIALSLLIVSFLSPILSGVADFSGSKKKFMRIFNYIGSLSCVGLFFWNSYPVEIGLFFCMTANIGFWGSLVFYNAYLPEIAEPKDHDIISAKGFSKGYLGGAILLVVCLVTIMVLKWDAEYSFLLVGIWWVGFAQITYRRLPGESNGKANGVSNKEMLSKGFKELKIVWKEFSKIRRLKRYLISFFVFSMAVQTIMTMAQFFGTEAIDWAIGMDFSTLGDLVGDKYEDAKNIMVDSRMRTGMIVSILAIQLIAIPGAMFFAYLSKKLGNINALIVVLSIWVCICVSAYILTSPLDFYILAGVVGFVMGGVQSLSRSTYSKFLPETEDHASYFSFYDVLEKIGMTIGIVSFGFLTGAFNIRYSIMALTVFFVIGLILLLFVPKQEKLKEA
jgi:UMF1 family MFS transporter